MRYIPKKLYSGTYCACLMYSYSNLTRYEKACSLLSGGSGGIFFPPSPPPLPFFRFVLAHFAAVFSAPRH